MTKRKKFSPVKAFFRFGFVLICASALTLFFFLLLPILQTISKPPKTDMVIQDVGVANVPPPPPPPEEEPPEEPEKEEKPPELNEQSQPLALDQLELALNPGFSGGIMAGDFSVKLNTAAAGGEDVDALFSISDLDQKPRPIYRPSPRMSKELRKRAPGKVYIIFIVDKNGRVQKPKVQRSTDPIFEKPALEAVKKWKFEPGKRNGSPVRFRMRVPITFPKG
ncbi:energy transducer TonB [Sedimentisphaera salicampi]|uniref:TonB C-terminal domain-containing protein n=1 Tax=Sedimentisphaera salicampi TaxID=1941349 RepID=A0A1W6LNC0_9BACT|nr:energy transducer TonB [Sedimentisphaera salicampi]ARN57242.1 hypothetical protein STSP1_01641 [Sedimentisphaera salicampi]OXU14683.1 hypothetical protein SMSP1_01563 [Sedimentisphaera salicampi]